MENDTNTIPDSPLEDFNPLQDNVQQREYTKPNVSGEIDATPIEEPVFAPPSFEELESKFSQQSEEATPATEPESANPYVNNLDSKDQKNASKALVEAVLDGYTQLNKFGSKAVQVKVEVVQQLMREGKIDNNLTIPVNNQNLPVLEYIQAYNAELGDVFDVDEDFKEKVRPVMLRVFMKRNIGMTDEQLLAYYFGVDIVTKISVGYSLVKQNKMLIESMMDITNQSKPVPKPQESRVEEKDNDFDTEPPLKRNTGENSKQREYVEPEEVIIEEEIQEAVEVNTADEDVKKGRTKAKQPEFGDSELLSHMEQVATEGQPKRKRGRPKKNK